jgi:hypothetical protein
MSRNFSPDQDLIDLLPLNDTSAFEELYKRHAFSLYSYCIGKLHSDEDARRIVRDIFVSLWEMRNALPSNFSVSLFFYQEVRKSVVRCVNEKLNDGKDLSIIQQNIIPGFSLNNLQHARLPVVSLPKEQTNVFHPTPENNKSLENWWSQLLPPINMKNFRYAFQRVMHLW